MKKIKSISKKEILNGYKGENNKISTCVRQLDEQIGGLPKGKLTSILGWTGCMKSIWALSMAYAAQLQGMNILYLSLETTKQEIYANLLSRHSNQMKFKMKIQHRAIRNKDLKKEEREYLKTDIMPDYDNLTGKIYILDEMDIDSYSMENLEQMFIEINNQAIKETGHGVDICVVDSINSLKNRCKVLNEKVSIDRYTTFFRQQSVNWCKTKQPVAMIVLAQSNRKGRRVY